MCVQRNGQVVPLLNHGGPRLIYGVKLTENTHAYLLGIDMRLKFISA
jgi:hypothetical protein